MPNLARKGDLATTALPDLLRSLAAQAFTGAVVLVDPEAEQGQIWLRNGLLYAAEAPGRRPQLGTRLVSSGALAPEALAEALEAQESELQGWRIGELLIHLGYVDPPVVEAFATEQVFDALTALAGWPTGRWRVRPGERTRDTSAPAITVDDALAMVEDRRRTWQQIYAEVGGTSGVPTLSTRGAGDGAAMLDPEAWSMLCKVDGERSLAELARDCGYTNFEAGHVVLTLVEARLVDVPELVEPEMAPVVHLDRYRAPAVDVDPEPVAEPEPEPTALLETVAAAIAGLSELPLQNDPEPEHLEPEHLEPEHPEPDYLVPDYLEPIGPALELHEPEATPASIAALLPPDLQMVHHGAPEVSEAGWEAELEEDRVAEPQAEPEEAREEQEHPIEAGPIYPGAVDEDAAADHESAVTAAALLTEFSATSTSEPLIPAPAGPVDPLELPAPAAQDEPDFEPPTPVRDITDTAALLRELSSLGFDDEPTPSARPLGSPSRGLAASTAAKKRKGLFGRG